MMYRGKQKLLWLFHTLVVLALIAALALTSLWHWFTALASRLFDSPVKCRKCGAEVPFDKMVPTDDFDSECFECYESERGLTS